MTKRISSLSRIVFNVLLLGLLFKFPIQVITTLLVTSGGYYIYNGYVKPYLEYKKELKNMQERYITAYDYASRRVNHIKTLEDTRGNTVIAEESFELDDALDQVANWPISSEYLQDEKSNKKLEEIQILRTTLEALRQSLLVSKTEESRTEIKNSIMQVKFLLQDELDAVNSWTANCKKPEDFLTLKDHNFKVQEILKRIKNKH